MRTGVEGRIVEMLAVQGRTIGAAESLTGGAVTARLVRVPGVSRVLRGGVTAYQVPVKESVLGLDAGLVRDHGVVSEPVALGMADGVCRLLGADIGVATTGVAGPGPSDGVPAGRVVVAVVATSQRAAPQRCVRTWQLAGHREAVRRGASELALALVVSALSMSGEQNRDRVRC